MATYNNIKKIKIGDNIFNLYDSGNSGGTITSIKTTAGAHTAINVSSGAVTFNVPTKTSHLTNDSNFITLDNIGVSNGLISITYNGIETISSTNFNLVNGSQTGSLRTVGSAAEDSSYTIGWYAFAEGDSTKAIGNDSHAEGYKTTASGLTAHAEGSATYASNSYSHAQNRGTIASKECQTAIGKYNIEDTATEIANQKALIIGNGTFSERSNALTVDWSGNTEQQGRATTNDMSTTDINNFVNNLNFRQSSLIDFFYPVGSYYETEDGTFNPNIAWGGTWALESTAKQPTGEFAINSGRNTVNFTTTSSKTIMTLSFTSKTGRVYVHGDFPFYTSRYTSAVSINIDGVQFGYTTTNSTTLQRGVVEGIANVEIGTHPLTAVLTPQDSGTTATLPPYNTSTLFVMDVANPNGGVYKWHRTA